MCKEARSIGDSQADRLLANALDAVVVEQTKVNLNWLVGEPFADTFFKLVTEAKDKFAGVMKQSDAKNKQKVQ